MNDQKLAARLREIIYLGEGDTESIHYSMDLEIIEALKELGFSESVEIFENEDKWYA